MKKYCKTIGGKTIIKNAEDIVIRSNGMQTFNPTEAQIIADGWVEYVAPIYTPTLEDIKERKVGEIIAYDDSKAVNDFTIGGVSAWLDKDTRSGLRLRFEAETAVGRTETTLWDKGQSFTLPLPQAQQLLLALELYASECYDNTQRHIGEVQKLDTIEAVEAYDYTIGYPAKLAF